MWAGFVDRTGLKPSSLLVSLIGTIVARPLFFAILQSYLSGEATAGGLAFIDCIGSLGGFVGPYLVEWLKDATGSYQSGMGGSW